MKIISKYRDYYDFVSKRYGEDPACIYLRRDFVMRDREIDVEYPRADLFQDTRARDSWGILPHLPSLVFVVAAKWCVPFFERGNAVTRVVFPEHDALFATKRVGRRDVPQRPGIPEGAVLEKIVRAVGVPVFKVLGWHFAYSDGKSYLRIDKRVPVLDHYGLSAIVPPEQMWQEVYSTLQNVLRVSPDRAPPVEVGNEYKIHAAGFDLKTSFRHPVNVMPKKAGKRPRK